MSATVTDGGVGARLAAMGGAVRQALVASSAALADQLRSAIDDALSGGVLNSRSGALIDSIRTDMSVDENGVTVRLGSSLPDAAFQELGFSGTERVREHLRRQSVAFGRPMTPRDVLVRAHAREVDYAGRAYLAGPLADMAEDIAATYGDSVREAVGP